MHALAHMQYHIALKFHWCTFLQIADFKLFAENFSQTARLCEKSAKVTTVLLNKFCEWLKIHEIHEI